MESTEAEAAPAADPPLEILPWLKSLPLAPEFHPTLIEFQDPISYILKIESQASKFGICKIVPPIHPSPKKTAFSNLNRSLAARHPQKCPVFPTRHQEIGLCPHRSRPVLKTVWESGESYVLQQFEAKSKQFERTHLKKSAKWGPLPLEIETLFWKASADRPFSVEYAGDIPGSGFAPVSAKRQRESGGQALAVADTAWNMREVSRAKGSLLRFVEEEVLGVTSPAVDVGMAFSWFAWHVEDHDFHGLNYLHVGAEKTWYGVPMDAAAAFEEVVRVHGYGAEVNPLVTVATLGKKTTVMSPEVLIGAGVPCCRLVQNAGEFVVTFPRAYHSGFSHGFNCGEVANIATPEWLRIAKEAAIRRASINNPPLVSHVQLLYALALTLCSRIPMSISNEPRSSRLKDKKRGEGDVMVKELFVQNVIENNDLMRALLENGASCILLPRNSSDVHLSSHLYAGSRIKVKPRQLLGLCSPKEATDGSKILLSDGIMLDRNSWLRHSNGSCSEKGKLVSVCQEGKRLPTVKYSRYGSNDLHGSTSGLWSMDCGKEATSQGGALLDGGRFSCVTCGILSFPCAAIIQPREAAATYLMFSDCNSFSDQIVGPGVNDDIDNGAGWMQKDDRDCLERIVVRSANYKAQVAGQRVESACDTVEYDISSLDLLASAYGDPSDSEEEAIRPDTSVCANDFSIESNKNEPGHQDADVVILGQPSSPLDSVNEVSAQMPGRTGAPHDVLRLATGRHPQFMKYSLRNSMESSILTEPLKGTNRNLKKTSGNIITSAGISHLTDAGRKELDGNHRTCIRMAKDSQCDVNMDDQDFDSADLCRYSENPSRCISNGAAAGRFVERTEFGNAGISVKNPMISFMRRSDNNSSRMHIFCLEHAVEVEKHLRAVGGVHMLLLCHPDYPKIEAEVKTLAEELGIDHLWKDIPYREANQDDIEVIRLALDGQEALQGNGDWAVKLGINLSYSASLSKSPLYSKQMPYNSVIYKAFGLRSPGNSLTKPKVSGRRPGRQKKIFVVGRWCGKVWMSNQVHPYLACRDTQEQENTKSRYQGIKQKLKVDVDVSLVEQTMLPKRSSLVGAPMMEGKSGIKRRKSLEKVGPKKPRWAQSIATTKPAEDLPNNPSQCGRVLRSRLAKSGTPLFLNDRRKSKSIGRMDSNSKIKTEGGPSTRLRKRPLKQQEVKVGREVVKVKVKVKQEVVKVSSTDERQVRKKKAIKAPSSKNVRVRKDEAEYQCDMDGCSMCFSTKRELSMHKRNICPVKGCEKKLFSHKYMVQHQRVHMDARPLKCPWKGCRMTFKWAWARTEHMRVHTGDRPYQCGEAGCGQTFRFVSDFSRHKRKTGHSVKKKRGRG
ncbi:lysine-specific demethylase REF6-like isoform X2 [Magnolia sinica]|uniref:lysine-specific demethylase REF6-like isoform X2 n=1 Tax=Magnolia sinica TaxID=86752 RepID=UPI00265A8288|nr:lysine-specific demethylase REF6-like isoform X2 [Magnolia sinica]